MPKRIANLDGLRFLAAWIVMLCHTEVVRGIFGQPFLSYRFFENSLHTAVTFFFVLSGFLISIFLLREKKESDNGKINILAFYRKRVLRIWPLYYLVVFLSFFVVNHISFLTVDESLNYFPLNKNPKEFLYYFFFMPNYAMLQYGSRIYLGLLWTLSVEEFFYLFFPIFITLCPYKKIPVFMLSTIVVFSILSFVFKYYGTLYPGSFFSNLYLNFFFSKYKIYSFTCGAFAAFVFTNGTISFPGLKIIKRKDISYSLLFLCFIFIVTGATFSFLTHQLYSVLFAILLLSLTTSGIRPFLLNNKLMEFLGKISFSLYLLHLFAVVFVVKTISPFISTGISWLNAVIIQLIVTVIAIVLASLSYLYFEKFFLKFREKRKKITV